MQNESNDNNQRGKKINWIKGILYFLILPFILMFFYAKFVLKAIREKNKVNMALSAAVFVLIVFSIVINPGTTSSSQENSANYSKDKVALSDNKIVENQTTEVVKEVTTENATEELKVVYNNLKDLESDELILNFIDACTSANIDVNNIRSLEKIDDWTAGKRYKFVYLGKEIILYTNMDFSISSLRTNGLRVFLYKEGHESLNVDDYITNSSITNNLESISKEYVKKRLNFPETAKFGLYDWGFGRYQNYYAVTGKVIAKNAFGVEDKLEFYFEYLIEDTTAKLVTFVMDGIYVVGSESKINSDYIGAQIEGLNVEKVDAENDSDDIILEYGKLGVHGKEIKIGNETSIGYFLSAGEYEVTNLVNYSILMIFKEKTIINSEGNEESVLVERIVFDSFESKKDIVLNEDEYFFISINTKLKMVPLD